MSRGLKQQGVKKTREQKTNRDSEYQIPLIAIDSKWIKKNYCCFIENLIRIAMLLALIIDTY